MASSPVHWSEVFAAGSPKRRIINAGVDEISTFAHKIDPADDLLTNILLRLPLTSLRLCKLVCKRWFSLITNPDFNHLLRNRNPNVKFSSGFILQLQTDSSVFALVPLNPRIPAKISPLITSFRFNLNSGYINVLQSCNGLLLCHAWPDKFYVYNPTVSLCKLLPLPPVWIANRYVHSMAIAFDPRVSPHYKLVYLRDAFTAPGSPIQIEICVYSSETGNWRFCDKTFSLASFAAFENGVYWNDAIHWIDYSHEVCHFDFDIENPHFMKVKTPRTLNGKPYLDHRYIDDKLLVSRDCLLLLQMVHFRHLNFLRMNVYEMKNDYSGWSIKYHVCIDRWDFGFQPGGSFIVLSLLLGEDEEDPYLLLEVSGKLIQYNIVSRSHHELCDLARIHPRDTKSCSFFFAPSLAGV